MEREAIVHFARGRYDLLVGHWWQGRVTGAVLAAQGQDPAVGILPTAGSSPLAADTVGTVATHALVVQGAVDPIVYETEMIATAHTRGAVEP